ncbi:MAG: hypothetical protein A2632_02990 [Candidatus Pacebacteria bacterium RIFCSPHIGHO2_01_FULL_46_16]|nr:MAG: hypothetical protein A2632_02990 [Candidatus Pacebacteria bacterium RIFCSPHIGHO2_01_FULL_46_16]OGJ20966.1 MAG: hypothetical protein A3J60_00780 [Candidatus Pacebacteria bacterium RIFCSPHIGHO2_02_FULL_46_9]OGJ38953.1 MAG: hypothetical protein A3A82_02305 [Candidatus Pacebacteria bacterium RIFCSPLOWO2_01_FULL_47_12]
MGLLYVSAALDTILRIRTNEIRPNWGNALKGLRVLDIGAGTALDEKYRIPWFSRICASLGAKVVVIDLKPQPEIDQELFFLTIVADIVGPVRTFRFAEILPEESRTFDIIYSSKLVAPDPDPGLQLTLTNQCISLEDFIVWLEKQAMDLLADGGVMHLGMTDRPDAGIVTKREQTK